MSEKLFKQWILSLLNDETPQACGWLEHKSGYSPLGDLMRLSLRGKDSGVTTCMYRRQVMYLYKDKGSRYLIPEQFLDECLEIVYEHANVICDRTMHLQRDSMSLYVKSLNDMMVSKPVTGLLIYSFVSNDELSTVVRSKYRKAMEPDEKGIVDPERIKNLHLDFEIRVLKNKLTDFGLADSIYTLGEVKI